MRVLFEKRVHEGLSRDNDTILAALNGGLAWHRRRKAKASRRPRPTQLPRSRAFNAETRPALPPIRFG